MCYIGEHHIEKPAHQKPVMPAYFTQCLLTQKLHVTGCRSCSAIYEEVSTVSSGFFVGVDGAFVFCLLCDYTANPYIRRCGEGRAFLLTYVVRLGLNG